MQLRHRPMAGKAAMAEPAKHVPADAPPRHADGQFRFGAQGAAPTGARWVWTAHQTVDDLCRSLESPQMMIPVIAHVHVTFADRARAILNIYIHPLACRLRRPTIRHGGYILVPKCGSVSPRSATIA